MIRQASQAKQVLWPGNHELPAADDPQGSKLLMVLEYVEGGPVLGGRGSEKTWKPVSEPVARTYFRDIVQVSKTAGHISAACRSAHVSMLDEVILVFDCFCWCP